MEQNPEKRYTAAECIQHPWITRRKNDEIPLTFSDKILLFNTN